MSVVRNLMVRIGADLSNLKAQMGKATTMVNQFGSSIGGQLAGAFGTYELANYMKASFQSAMKVESATQTLNATLGESAGAFEQWAQTSALSYNLSREAALDYGRTFSNLISNFTDGTDQTVSRTESLLKASAVIASSTGRTMDDVLERIRSGLLGNTEAIEDLGVNVNVAMLESTDAFRKFAGGKSWDQLDFRTQQTIRYFGILEQTSKRFGTDLFDNTASRFQQMQANLANVQTSIGEAFLPLLNEILPPLTRLISWFGKQLQYDVYFFRALFGYAAPAAKQTATAVGGVNEKLKKTTTQLKNAKAAAGGFLAGFDEVNAVAKATADTVNNLTPGGTGTFVPTPPSQEELRQMDEIKSSAESLAAAVKQYFDNFDAGLDYIGEFWAGVWQGIKDGYNSTTTWFSDTWMSISNWFSSLGTSISNWWNESKKAVGQSQLRVDTTGWDTAISGWFSGLGTKISTWWSNAWKSLKYDATSVSNWFTGVGTSIKTWFTTTWSKLGETLTTAKSGVVTAANNVWAAVKPAFATVGTFFANTWQKIASGLDAVIAEVKLAAGRVWDAIKSVFTGVGDWFRTNLGKPISDAFDSVKNWITGSTSMLPSSPANLKGVPKAFNQPPKLGAGGIVNKPMTATIGEAGPEMIVPLERTSFVDQLASSLGTAVMSAMQFGQQTGGHQEVTIKLDGATLAKAIAPYTTKESSRLGSSLITVR